MNNENNPGTVDRPRPGTRDLRRAAALACLLGSVSIGWDCAGTATQSAHDAGGEVTTGTGGLPGQSDAGRRKGMSDAATSDADVVAPSQSPQRDAASDADDAAHGIAGNDICAQDYASCATDGSTCCNLGCSMGVCGGCFAEGEHCSYDGGVAPVGVAACCGGLACNAGFCGTNACVPDGTACGGDAGVVCCNDNCDGTVCKS